MRVPLVVVLALAGARAVGPSARAAARELPNLGGPPAEPEGPPGAIARVSSKAEDRAIEKRLREIFGQVEGLGSVAVEVRDEIVEARDLERRLRPVLAEDPIRD